MRYFLFQKYRNEPLPAEQVAEKLRRDSPGRLYQELRADGFPVCLLCGGYALKSDFCDECGGASARHLRRATGEAEELPPSANATDLFRSVLENCSRTVRGLHYRVERYRAGRAGGFEKLDVHHGHTALLSRSLFTSEEQWRNACEEIGQDPHQDSSTIFPQQMNNAVGVNASPRDTALIAAYFLSDEPQEQSEEQRLEALLQALHPDPCKADRQKLLYGNPNSPEQHPGEIEELRRVARQVARLVRGVPIGGAPSENVTGEGLNIKWYIANQLQSGAPYEEVKRELVSKGYEESKIDSLKNQDTFPPH